jgi:hemerythrin-like domain-containing protein
MSPTERLDQEHAHIQRLLAALERLVRRLHDEDPPLDGLEEALGLLRGFADAAHHGKEERHLFPALGVAGLSNEVGPVAVMLLEHDAGRRELDDIAEALGALRAGVPEGAGRLARAASRYAALMRDHIDKEDQVLFPMARELLPRGVAAALAGEYARVDEEALGPGGYARALARLDALVAAAGGPAAPRARGPDGSRPS